MVQTMSLAGSLRVQPLTRRVAFTSSKRSHSKVQAIAQPTVRNADHGVKISPLTLLQRSNELNRLRNASLRFVAEQRSQVTPPVLVGQRSPLPTTLQHNQETRDLAKLSSPEHSEEPSSSASTSDSTGDEAEFLQLVTIANKSKKSKNSPLLPPALQAIIDKVPARVRGLVMLNLLVVMVATNWVVLKDAGTHMDPFIFATMRFGIAAAALSPFLLKAKLPTFTAGLELGVYTAVGYLAQSEGLLTTDASRASFLSTFTVLVVPFLAGINGRGVRPLTWAAAVAALVGVSLLEQSGAAPCMGDVWSIISAIAFGVQIFRTEHFSRILGKGQMLPLMSVVLATTAVLAAGAAGGTLPALITTAIANPATALAAAVGAHIPWLQVLYTGLFTTDVALLMELVALRDVTSTEAAIIYTMEPVLGAGLAFAVLGERWGPTGWIGAALIVGSCLGMQLTGSDEGAPVLESMSESDE